MAELSSMSFPDPRSLDSVSWLGEHGLAS